MTPPETLGRLEFDVLSYVSDHAPISVRDVAAYFAATSGQARTTVLTVMERLRNKGFLTRKKIEGRHQYRPTIAKAKLLERMVGKFVDDVLGGSVSPFVAYLTRSPLLDDAEARKLAELLKRIESRAEKDQR